MKKDRKIKTKKKDGNMKEERQMKKHERRRKKTHGQQGAILAPYSLVIHIAKRQR
jgi:hypothetical protein